MESNVSWLKITLGDDTQWFDDLTVTVDGKVLDQLLTLGNKQSILISPAKTRTKVNRIKLQSGRTTYTGVLDDERTLNEGDAGWFPTYSIRIEANEVHN